MKKPKASASIYKKLSSLAYKKHADQINKDIPEGYKLDENLSTRETKVFYNPTTKKAVVAYRGTDLRDPKRILKDLKSDFNILTGREKKDKRFQEALAEFQGIHNHYKNQGYTIDTTGHSLGGALATHVNRANQDKVDENLSFSRGSGILEPFRKRPKNTYDYSHKKDLISLGARLSKDEEGGQERNFVSGTKTKNMLEAHGVDRLDTFKNTPQLHSY